jgi:hypothetical protein
MPTASVDVSANVRVDGKLGLEQYELDSETVRDRSVLELKDTSYVGDIETTSVKELKASVSLKEMKNSISVKEI